MLSIRGQKFPTNTNTLLLFAKGRVFRVMGRLTRQKGRPKITHIIFRVAKTLCRRGI
jgi:hypothetical protein